MPFDEKTFKFEMLTASKMKMIVAKDPHIEDRDLSRKLGCSMLQLKNIKLFCSMNKMKVNQPLSNKAKKDMRILKDEK